MTILHDDATRRIVEQRIVDILNASEDFLSPRSVNSPRSVGDAVERVVADNLETILGKDVCRNYSDSFARRAMADIAFEDVDGRYYIVDVKTHRVSTKFNMPNLTSVERLSRFYEEDSNVFALLHVDYDIEGSRVVVSGVHFIPIELLDWRCLTIGALGWGQIQISNANNIMITASSRKKWMIQLCDELLEFYPKEIGKIGDRIARFEEGKRRWLAKPDD
jgi:hypothetical protein